MVHGITPAASFNHANRCTASCVNAPLWFELRETDIVCCNNDIASN